MGPCEKRALRWALAALADLANSGLWAEDGP